MVKVVGSSIDLMSLIGVLQGLWGFATLVFVPRRNAGPGQEVAVAENG